MKDGNLTILYTKETRSLVFARPERQRRSASFVSLQVTWSLSRERRALERGEVSLACQRSNLITPVITPGLFHPER
jgi:hypothetical protein